jgi:hypothetical protein
MAKTYAAGLFSAITAAATTTAASRLPQTTFSDGAIPSSSSKTESSSKVRNDNPRTTSSGPDPVLLEQAVEALKQISASSNAKKVSFRFLFVYYNLFDYDFGSCLGFLFV